MSNKMHPIVNALFIGALLVSACGGNSKAKDTKATQLPETPTPIILPTEVPTIIPIESISQAEVDKAIKDTKLEILDPEIMCVNDFDFKFVEIPIEETVDSISYVPAQTRSPFKERFTIEIDPSKFIPAYKQFLVERPELKNVYSIDKFVKFILWHEYFHACKNNSIMQLSEPVELNNGAFWSAISGASIGIENATSSWWMIEIEEGFATVFGMMKAGIPLEKNNILGYPVMTEFIMSLKNAGYMDVEKMASLLISKDPKDVEKFWYLFFGSHDLSKDKALGVSYAQNLINVIMSMYDSIDPLSPIEAFSEVEWIYKLKKVKDSKQDVHPGSILIQTP